MFTYSKILEQHYNSNEVASHISSFDNVALNRSKVNAKLKERFFKENEDNEDDENDGNQGVNNLNNIDCQEKLEDVPNKQGNF